MVLLRVYYTPLDTRWVDAGGLTLTLLQDLRALMLSGSLNKKELSDPAPESDSSFLFHKNDGTVLDQSAG